MDTRTTKELGAIATTKDLGAVVYGRRIISGAYGPIPLNAVGDAVLVEGIITAGNITVNGTVSVTGLTACDTTNVTITSMPEHLDTDDDDVTAGQIIPIVINENYIYSKIGGDWIRQQGNANGSAFVQVNGIWTPGGDLAMDDTLNAVKCVIQDGGNIITVDGSVNVGNFPTGWATENKQDDTIDELKTLNSLIPSVYDYIGMTYTGAVLTGVVFKTGGSGGTTVSTLTLAYTGSNLTSVTKT